MLTAPSRCCLNCLLDRTMETDSCLPFSAQSGVRTPANSPGLEHGGGGGGSGSFLPCDELQKPSHLRPPPPLPAASLTHRLGLRRDLYATAAMGRFGDAAAADFTHGSPPKHKFLDSLNPDHKAAISDKAAFYESSSEGE
ncbi:hypothetical protein CHARACLAT_004040 [Characodon lateralis]|uniref:Uncharacterized protein n=1 Tax=Characodon lateralis TaxID=208331 RepID=A0ABU7ETR0_9TELE|nr:hypothetical protein [Characodon lateralis]